MTSTAPRSERLFSDDKQSVSCGALGADRTTTMTVTQDEHSLSKSEEPAIDTFLQTPSWPIVRPLSPDTVSNLSVEEYSQLRPHLFGDLNADDDAHNHTVSGWRGSMAGSWRRNKGLAYMLIAQVFGTMMNVTVRLLEIEGKGMHPIHILFVRMVITLALSSGYMWWMKTPDFPFGKPEVRWLLIARGFGGFFGVFGMYYSLLYLPLADATVITFLAPSLACWACSILINEPFTRSEQIGGLISMVGVLLIAKPTGFFSGHDSSPSNSDRASQGGVPTAAIDGRGDASNYDNVTPTQRLIAVGVALTGVLGAATAYTTIRWIGKRAHPLISVNYFAAWCTIVSLVAQLVIPGVGFLLPATLKEWAYLIFLGICGFIMQFLLAAGLSYEKSSRSTNMAYTQMLFALAFDKIVFNHSPGWISIIGSSLILGPAIIVALQKDAGKSVQQQEPSDHIEDEESQRSLIGFDHQLHEVTNNDRMEVHDIQLRSLR